MEQRWNRDGNAFLASSHPSFGPWHHVVPQITLGIALETLKHSWSGLDNPVLLMASHIVRITGYFKAF